MDATRFDLMTKRFAGRLSRRRAVGVAAALAAGLTATTRAQGTTPATPPVAGEGPTMLFSQSFQAGSVVPKEGAP